MVCVFKLPSISKWSVKSIIFIIFLVSLCLFFHVWIMRDVIQFVNNINKMLSNVKNHNEVTSHRKGTKYILLWDRYYLIITNGKSVFPNLNCSVSNCIFTKNKGLLDGDYTRFDAIIFNEVHLDSNMGRPKKRSKSQLYIFTTIESAYNQPACELYNDDFFNWTFTYRLDSDIVWNYFVVRNISKAVIAPSKDVNWKTIMYPIHPKIRAILRGKSKTAAWLVSHCRADSLRDEYLTSLQDHLYQYSLTIDVYGNCSRRKCSNGDCKSMLRNDYYFYMAFENSLSEDYVTEKVLHGYDNYAVPIVYGAANYYRFLPPGSYINAREIHPHNLAFTMYRAVNDPAIYENYFRWTNSYTIDSDPMIYHPLCDLCKALNSEKAKFVPAKKNFRRWWNGLNGMKWCLPAEYWNETSRINIDSRHIYSPY